MGKKAKPANLTSIMTDSINIQTLYSLEDFEVLRDKIDVLAAQEQKSPAYLIGFANSRRCVEAVLRLRYEVFNVEMGKGLSDSRLTGLDQDPFDEQMTHLVLIEKATECIIGTYRLQTAAQAGAGRGFYSAQEYDLTPLEPQFEISTECGRACIKQGHRSMTTVLLLWLGIAEFMNLHSQRYLFGCSSLSSQNPDDGWRAMKTLRARNHFHPECWLKANPDYTCGNESREFDEDLGPAIPLPKLFNAYMRLGAQVISEPALDREFGTVDFLVMLDAHQVKMSTVDVVGESFRLKKNSR